MKRVDLLVDGARRTMQVGAASCVWDGRESRLDVADLGDGLYSVILDGRQHAVHVAPRGRDACEATVDGTAVSIEIRDARRLAPRPPSTSASGAQEVRSPMPGKVVAVHVAAGDRAERGGALLVVEAMKMQNELRSTRDGTVASVNVAAGDSVSAGDLLAVVE